MTESVETVSIGMKLDGKNFPVWSRLMRISVGSRKKLHHLEGDAEPPQSDDPKFQEWQATDFTVFSWLIQNMEQKLVVQFAQHQTANAMWKSLNTTFGVRADPVQVYDLEVRTIKLVQGDDTLEFYWSELQNLWTNTDARKPCPYTCCEKGVNTYQKQTEIKRLYQFLIGLNDRYDGIRREILKLGDIPAEEAFGIVKQEEGRTGVWRPGVRPTESNDAGIGAGFGARPPPHYNQNRPPAPPHNRSQPSSPPPRNSNNRRNQIDKSKLVCSHCGMPKHTKENCFQLIGFPEWWEDGHKANKPARGRAAIGRDDQREPDFATPAGNQVTAGSGRDNSGGSATPKGG